MPTSHPSGWAHADGALRGPHWLREPEDANQLIPQLWSSTAEKVDGVLHVGGAAVPDVVADVNTPAYLLDETDFRSRARAFRDAFASQASRNSFANQASRDAFANQAFRDAKANQAFRDAMANQAFRDAMGNQAFRDAMGNQAFRDAMKGDVMKSDAMKSDAMKASNR